MAFLPQPTLPSTTKPSSKVRVSTRAVADGVISVSRRRRVFEFLSATSKTVSSTAPDSAAVHVAAPASTTGASEDVPDTNEVRDQLIARMKQREEAVKADAAKKQALWQAELDALRSLDLQPAQTSSAEIAAQAPSTPPKSYSPSMSNQTASVFGADDVTAGTKSSPAAAAAASASTTISSATPAASAATAPTAPAPSKAAPAPAKAASVRSAPAAATSATTQERAAAASVSDLYGPPSGTEESEDSRPWRIQNIVEDVREAVEDVRDAVEDAVEDMRDAVEDVVEDVIEVFQPEEEEAAKEEKAPEPAAESKPNTKQDIKEDQEDRSIGKVVLDAIVEGVDTSEPESEKPAVDKSDLIELVDSGKIKNLTVTKLRRLLTQNGLKTSGRKAELIARLTSFAKAK